MKSTRCTIAALLTAACLWAFSAHAAEDCGPNQYRCVPVGTWELKVGVGLGLRTNPLRNSDDIPLVLIPQVSYYGKRFFLDNLDLGYTLIDRRDFMLNALITPSSDSLFFFRKGWRNFLLDGGLRTTGGNFSPIGDQPPTLGDNSNLGAEGPEREDNAEEGPSPLVENKPSGNLRKRRTAGMAGLEASSSVGSLDWQLQLLTDVTGVHDGEELRFALSQSHQQGEHQLGLTMGINWKSAALLEYYYGVRAEEASQLLPAYNPSSGATPFVRVSWSKAINRDWRWLGSVQYEHLSRAIRNSPIVTDDQVVQIFVGGVYHF